MIFDKLNEKYLEDAVRLANAQYNMEQKYVEALYEKGYKDILAHMICEMFNG